ncbi:hypothetical protein GTQ40_04790 [Flavobacteriaceae bacterium R38]|nr:hypothetical protein [Flavobacteriaceae bacterium R38]
MRNNKNDEFKKNRINFSFKGVFYGLAASVVLILLHGGYESSSLQKILMVKMFLVLFYVFVMPNLFNKKEMS